MHPYLSRLGVDQEVQEFFEPFYSAGPHGDLCFSYGEDVERYGLAFHRVPVTPGFWRAGNLHFSQVSQVIVCSSAMDAIAWLQTHRHFFPTLHGLLFLSLAAAPRATHINWIKQFLPGKQFRLLFPKDILGNIADLKLAAGIRQIPIEIYLLPGEKLGVQFRLKTYVFEQAVFSLHAFEIAAGFRFHIPTQKPRAFESYFQQLKASAGIIT